MTAPFRPRIMLEALARHGVRYVVIGGVAVAVHGVPRGTFDLDIVVAPTPENFERLAAALVDLGAERRVEDSQFTELDPGDPFDLARGHNYRIVTKGGRLDILNRAKGAIPYDDLAARATIAEAFGVEIAIAGVEDLLRMKKAAGREKDLRDIADLTRPLDQDRPD